MGRIGPRRNRREVAGPAAGPMGPMSDRPPNWQSAAIFPLSPNRLKINFDNGQGFICGALEGRQGRFGGGAGFAEG